MVNFDEMRERAVATAGMVADKSVELAKTTADKAKLLGRIAKLNTEIAMEKDSVRKTYTELGKKYYEQSKDSPAPEMAQGCADITTALEVVEKKKQQIAQLKKELTESYGETAEEAVTPEIHIVDTEPETETEPEAPAPKPGEEPEE